MIWKHQSEKKDTYSNRKKGYTRWIDWDRLELLENWIRSNANGVWEPSVCAKDCRISLPLKSLSWKMTTGRGLFANKRDNWTNDLLRW